MDRICLGLLSMMLIMNISGYSLFAGQLSERNRQQIAGSAFDLNNLHSACVFFHWYSPLFFLLCHSFGAAEPLAWLAFFYVPIVTPCSKVDWLRPCVNLDPSHSADIEHAHSLIAFLKRYRHIYIYIYASSDFSPRNKICCLASRSAIMDWDDWLIDIHDPYAGFYTTR